MNLNTLISRLAPKADWVGLRKVREKIWQYSVKNGNTDSNSYSETEGLMIEVMKNGFLTYASLDNLNQENIELAFNRALKLCERVAPYKILHFENNLRPTHKLKWNSPAQKKMNSEHMGNIHHLLLSSDNLLRKAPHVRTSSGSVWITETETEMCCSLGREIFQNIKNVGYDQQITAEKNGEIQTRTTGRFANMRQSGIEFLNEERMHQDAERLAIEVEELLVAPHCPTGTMDLILPPDQMYIQIHESIGHALEIDRILGDERNYAGWSFVKPEDFGKLQYGSKLLNVTFDPTEIGEDASYGCDDIGNIAKKEYLIKDGVLLKGLGSLESQKRSGLSGVANQRACSWNRPPIDRMANLNVECGNSTMSDMIKAVENGVIMHTNNSWSIDDYRNKFQFGAEYGRIIKDGQLKEVVKNPNYKGISNPFWRNLKMVGDRSTFEISGSPYCGKGEPNQMVKVGHASPACLFNSIEVFGGHK